MRFEAPPTQFLETPPAESERHLNLQQYALTPEHEEMRNYVTRILLETPFAGLQQEILSRAAVVEETNDDKEKQEDLLEAWWLLGGIRHKYADFFAKNHHFEYSGEREIRLSAHKHFPEHNTGLEQWLTTHSREGEAPLKDINWTNVQ